MISTKTVSIFHGFYKFSKRNVAVAAAACIGGTTALQPQQHFAENVVKPMVLAKEFVNVDAARARRSPERPLLHVRTPTVRDMFGEYQISITQLKIRIVNYITFNSNTYC